MYRHWYSVPTGTPRNAETSCTVHKRSAIAAWSLPLCVTFITDLSRLAPDSLSQTFRFLISPERHLWRTRHLRCEATSLALRGAQRRQRSPQWVDSDSRQTVRAPLVAAALSGKTRPSP
jgi:hypothetical protein